MNWTSAAQAIRAAAKFEIVGQGRTRRRDRPASPRHRLDFDPLESRSLLTPVTVTITDFVEQKNPDSYHFGGNGDYYPRVRIDGYGVEKYDPIDGDTYSALLPAGGEPNYTIYPNWSFTKDVDPAISPTTIVEISIVDDDPGPDDQVDINPSPDLKTLRLTVDLATGNWSGDVPLNQGFAEGDGNDADGSGFVRFDISTISDSTTTAISDKYRELGGHFGSLGEFVSPERRTPDGQGGFRMYQRGSIYWSPQTGAHVVTGAIRDKWASLGWERSSLGYPTTDQLTTPDGVGRYNHFQRGSIYWSPQTGRYVVFLTPSVYVTATDSHAR